MTVEPGDFSRWRDDAPAQTLPETLAELRAAANLAAPKRSVVYLGDSLTFNGGGASFVTADNDRSGTAFPVWTQILTGERLTPIHNAGIGGEIVSQMAARVKSDVIARSPGVCVFLGGINDIKGAPATALSAMQASVTSILDDLYAAGIFAIICTVPPSDLLDLATEKAQLFAWNQWIISLGQTRRGLAVCDTYSAVADPAAVTFLAGFSTDGTHPNSRAAQAIATRLAVIINQMFAPASTLTAGAGDPSELMPNAMMNGNAAGFATSVSSIGGAVAKVARTDATGEWQQWTLSAIGTNTLLQDCTAGFVAGEQVYGTFEVETDAGWAGVSTLFFGVEFRDAGNVVLSTRTSLLDSTHTNQPRLAAGIVRSNPLTIPATTTRIRLLVRVVTTTVGPQVMRIGRMSLRKVGT